jgi:hypothetical protein
MLKQATAASVKKNKDHADAILVENNAYGKESPLHSTYS